MGGFAGQCSLFRHDNFLLPFAINIHPPSAKDPSAEMGKVAWVRNLKQELSSLWNKRYRFEIRAAGDILWEARRAFVADGCLNLSAALAFYSILSLIPFLFLLISGASYLFDSSEAAFRMSLSLFDQVLPHSSSFIFHEVKSISERAGVMGWAGFLSMLWTASVIFSSLEFTMGVIFRVEGRRKFFRARLLALSLLPASALVFLLSFSVTALSGILQKMEITFFGINLVNYLSLDFLIGYLLPYMILAIGFTAIYKIIPNTHILLHHALAGGACCAFLFEMAKHFFTWYLKTFSRYSVIYGSLEAIIIVVLWTFYSACILLFCAEVVSAYRRRDITLLQHAF
jgi:membrane protein